MTETDHHLHHVGITVPDIAAALAFYRDVLGLPVLDRFEVSGEAFATAVDVAGATGTFAHLDAGGARLELVEYDPEGEPVDQPALNRPGATHVGVAVDDLESFYDDLPADVETVSEPQTTESGASICFLRDPAGNRVELIEV